ncbi:hypothetical protein BXY39_0650 [Eilatimonas milleporae]|uniref:Uncharacterized protein n=1 Tax=Eilatimonas milleporae TaxID=911205 RepID=A0A3M0CRP4_9PROT|nr:hypothetical protein BXY39_0650 [Eilatimonas milleporae]
MPGDARARGSICRQRQNSGNDPATENSALCRGIYGRTICELRGAHGKFSGSRANPFNQPAPKSWRRHYQRTICVVTRTPWQSAGGLRPSTFMARSRAVVGSWHVRASDAHAYAQFPHRLQGGKQPLSHGGKPVFPAVVKTPIPGRNHTGPLPSGHSPPARHRTGTEYGRAYGLGIRSGIWIDNRAA